MVAQPIMQVIDQLQKIKVAFIGVLVIEKEKDLEMQIQLIMILKNS